MTKGFVLGALLGAAVLATAASPPETSLPFRLHLPGEPSVIDPGFQRTPTSSYLLQNLFRNLYSFDDDKGLQPDLADFCKRKSKAQPNILTCRLKKVFWSDGKVLTASDFLIHYQKLLNPKAPAPRADLLFPIVNAEAILQGKKKMSELGVRAPDSRTLVFELRGPSSDFEYLLATNLLAPFRSGSVGDASLPTSGPYKITKWTAGQRILTENNEFYWLKAPRPPVEYLFVEEDSTALKLFEKKELDFLRRLPTAYIPVKKGTPEFHWVPVSRFDHMAFGPRLRDRPDWRKAISLSLDFDQMREIFHSEGRPGCVGLPKEWMGGKDLCLDFNVAEAKRNLDSLKEKDLVLTYAYSTQGGEDHRRAAEWQQDQWKKNLGLQVRVKGLENKIFLTQIKESPPDIYRRGVAADRPTCFAALELFVRNSEIPELKTGDFAKIMDDLQNSPAGPSKAKACRRALESLINHHHLIPLGPMHFAVLVNPKFTGWKMNQMNQLDLARLKR